MLRAIVGTFVGPFIGIGKAVVGGLTANKDKAEEGKGDSDRPRKEILKVLNGVSGVIRPGTLTL